VERKFWLLVWQKIYSSFDMIPKNVILNLFRAESHTHQADPVIMVLMLHACRIGEPEVILYLENVVNIGCFRVWL
jgi:hypothetical protein